MINGPLYDPDNGPHYELHYGLRYAMDSAPRGSRSLAALQVELRIGPRDEPPGGPRYAWAAGGDAGPATAPPSRWTFRVGLAA